MKSDQTPRSSLSYNFGIFLQYLAFALILFGIKLSLIHFYGNGTPYWDQWDAEAASLYKPFLEGTLGWKDLLAPHNEHYIFITRLLVLAELMINGLWNPLLQMVVNAALHIAAILLIISLLARVIGRKYLAALLIFALVLLSVPYAWENTLAGIQSVFYFVLFFSTACLWLTVTRAPCSAGWWSGIVFAVLAFFSLASGIFALAAAAVVGLFLYAAGLQKTPKQMTAIAVLAGLFIFGAAMTPTLAHHASLKADSPMQFYDALRSILSWPASSKFYYVIIRNLPALIFIRSMLKTRPPANDRKWFLVALIVWMFGTALSIAYGRATGGLASRYLDLFVIFILINFACLILMTFERIQQKHRWSIVGGAALWIFAIFMALALRAVDKLPSELEAKRDTGLFQEVNTRNYLQTGDANHLRNKPFLHVPYPDSERLISLLASPAIHEILPSNLRPALRPTSFEIKPTDAFVTDGFDPKILERSHSILGSYNTQGNAATGKASVHFDGSPQARTIAIPIAGFPLKPGISLELVQNGQQRTLVVNKDQKNSWGIAYAQPLVGPFTIQLTDATPEAWIAIDSPSVAGNLDELVTGLLYNYYVFIYCGLSLVLLMAAKYLHGRFKKQTLQ